MHKPEVRLVRGEGLYVERESGVQRVTSPALDVLTDPNFGIRVESTVDAGQNRLAFTYSWKALDLPLKVLDQPGTEFLAYDVDAHLFYGARRSATAYESHALGIHSRGDNECIQSLPLAIEQQAIRSLFAQESSSDFETAVVVAFDKQELDVSSLGLRHIWMVDATSARMPGSSIADADLPLSAIVAQMDSFG